MQDVQTTQSLAPLLFLGPAIALWWVAGRDARKSFRMQSWPHVEGVIRDVRTRPMTRHSVAVEVQMDYSWEGQTKSRWCGSPTRSGFGVKTAADQIALNTRVASYVIGSSRDVLVNPDNPDEAYIRLPEWHMIIVCMVGGMLFTVLAILLAFYVPAG
jgi:hypothetical protein